MKQIFMLIFLVITSSCARLEFVNTNKMPLKVSAVKTSTREVEITGTADMYFFGMFPPKMVIDLSTHIDRMGLVDPSFMRIEEYKTTSSILYSLFTMGLYYPVDYKIKLLSAKEKIE